MTDEQRAWQDNARAGEIRELLSAVIDTCLSSEKYEPKDITRALLETTIATAVATFQAIDAKKDYERALDTTNDYMHDMTGAVIKGLRGAGKEPVIQ